MKFGWKSTSALRAAIVLSAIAAGMAAGGILLPGGAIARLRSFAGSGLATFGTAMATLGVAVLLVAVLERIGEKQEQVKPDLLDAFLEHIPENVFFKDLNSRFIRVSDSMAKYCGLESSAEAANRSDADIFSAEHASEARADEEEAIRTGRPTIGKEEKETWPDGHETWVLTTKVPMRDRSGQIIGTMGISHNITDRKQAEIQVRHMALHDPLTGLPNRALLREQLKQRLAATKRNGKKLAVLLLDLDRFKYVNDSLGHHAGDCLLEAVAARLRRSMRGGDAVARLAGDEFVVVIPEIGSEKDVERVARKVLDAVAEPIEVENHELQVTASIGISMYPVSGENPDVLLQYADAAMYDAKKKGRGRYSFFSPALTEATQRQQKLERDLVNACSRDQFQVYYQAIVEAGSGRIAGMEALLRWKHPEEGLISPMQFIPQLEEMGLMVETGRWVLRTACRQAAEWKAEGLPPVRVTVNVSAQQLDEDNIARTVETALEEAGLDPEQLELELTESRIIDDSEDSISTLRHLKLIGVSLSLDDFGTKWSSLSYRRRLPVDRIKIDRAFVRDAVSQPTAEAMVKSILGIAQSLGLLTVAEGIETAQQRNLLRRLGCTEMQGFFFSKPLPAIDATALLRSETINPSVLPFRAAGRGGEEAALEYSTPPADEKAGSIGAWVH